MTEREQVILRAIAHVGRGGPAEISKVVKAVGYPKATTKKVLIDLAEQGSIALHRHDWPSSLAATDRRLMIRWKGDYFNAVTVLKKNPKGRHLPGLPKKAQREYEHVLKSELAMGRTVKRAKAIAAGKVRKDSARKQNKTIIKAKRVVVLNKGTKPRRNSARIDSAGWAREMGRLRDIKPRPLAKLYGARGPSPEQKAAWDAAMRDWNKLYRHASKMQKITLKEDNERFRAQQNGAISRHTKRPAKTRAGAFRVGHKTVKSRKRVAKRNTGTLKKLVSKAVKAVKKAVTKKPNPTRKGMRKLYAEAKRISKITRGRHFSSESGQRKAARHEKTHARKAKRNPSASEIRKTFAGRHDRDDRLIFPDGTPTGLAKLGRLVSISTDAGRIAPVNGTVWLCSDTKGKLHLGTPTKGHVIFGGPATNYGHVREIEYEESKPHLGYAKKTLFFHRLGEETGVKPRLVTDGKGGAKFIGGAYKIKREGIIN